MKTPKMNATDIFKRLSFLKNNLSLLVPILIAVVALLLFIPTRILSGKLRDTVTRQSGQVGRSVTSLIGRAEQAAKAKQLEPLVTAYAKDANQIENLMKQTTLRELLTYQIFPDTNERTALLFEQFDERYRSGIDAMLKSVKAGVPPTDSEIRAALERTPQSTFGGAYGSPYGGRNPSRMSGPMGPAVPGRDRQFTSFSLPETQRKIVDNISLEKARAAGVYLSPVDLAGYTYWSDWKFENRDAAYRDCWYYQLGYWAIEDVIATVGKMNQNATSILDAPVKRVMNTGFVFGRSGMRRSMRRPGVGAIRTKKEGENPTYVTSARNAMSTPCTGRVCNEDIDVFHFEVRTIVDARYVMEFMKELCSAKEHKFRGWKGTGPEQTYKHNQITILETNVAPVDKMDLDHDFYVYGDEPVVDLDLFCEYVLNKPAYEEIKPQLIKDDIANANAPANKKK
jgi:hypothetical protein